MQVRIDIIFKKNFKYLGLIIQENGEVDDDVTHHVWIGVNETEARIVFQ